MSTEAPYRYLVTYMVVGLPQTKVGQCQFNGDTVDFTDEDLTTLRASIAEDYPTGATVVLTNLIRLNPGLGDSPWKDAVINACIINHQSFYTDSPLKTLAALIEVEVQMALDPAISERAQKLIDYGVEQERKRLGISAKAPENIAGIAPEDLRIDVYRATKDGSAWVNQTAIAVRITHLPTGIFAESSEERSAHKNKEVALQALLNKLASPKGSAIDCKEKT